MSRMTVLLALVSVSPGVAQKVRVDYDHGCTFSRYKTYRWVGFDKGQSPDVPFPNQLMQQRIVTLVQEALASKGLTHVQTGGDLVVGYELRATALPQFNTFTDATGPGWGWDGWGWSGAGCCGWGSGWGGGWGISAFSTTTTQAIWTGTLVVSMTDARQQQLVFQGVSTDTISSKAEKNTKRLQKGICEMFEKYPPRK